MFGGCYRGRRVLVTGHTGFKGSWLALWLSTVGAEVSGLALDPATAPNHWDLLGLQLADLRIDIRQPIEVADALQRLQPEIVFHLAAQPLVRQSYAEPLETWSTNVMGTAHVLEACRHVGSVRAIVVITSDKCYENREAHGGYREDDALGGHDPYSASKAGAEILASSYRRSFFHQGDSARLATARAGNVIGGGDWSADRLVPDLVRAVAAGDKLAIRSPRSVRPWQHVLESLSGYLLLGQALLAGESQAASAWNFGPPAGEACTVEALLRELRQHWPRLEWAATPGEHPHEAGLLHLDSTKAREQLGWRPVWTLPQSLAATAQWYRAWMDEGRVITREQLANYLRAARQAGLDWARP